MICMVRIIYTLNNFPKFIFAKFENRGNYCLVSQGSILIMAEQQFAHVYLVGTVHIHHQWQQARDQGHTNVVQYLMSFV